MSYPAFAEVQALIDRFAAGSKPMRVLEAGCGSLPQAIDLGADAHLVGIDVSRTQLLANTAVDERVLGDVQTHAFPADSFDLVLCWDVLEHLPEPEKALDNFRSAVRPGGLILLKLPNVASVKGLVTKFTPHRFHVWVYRRLLGYPNAGREGFTPFRTHLRWSLAPRRLERYAESHGMRVDYQALIEADRQTSLRRRLRLTGRPWTTVASAFRVVSRGWLELEGTELVLVLRKP